MRRSPTIGETVMQVCNERQCGLCLALSRNPARGLTLASTVGHADEVWHGLVAVAVHHLRSLLFLWFCKARRASADWSGLPVGIDECVMEKPRHQLLLFALKSGVILTKLQ